MSKRRLLVAGGLIAVAAVVILLIVASAQMSALGKQLFQSGVLLGIAIAIFSETLVTYVFEALRKPVWRVDMEALNTRISKLETTMEALDTRYGAHIDALVKAIGGPFTKSLFAYPPLTSHRVAEIVGEEADRLYQQHHKRVVVTEGKDTYRLVGLEPYQFSDANEPVYVWSIHFLIRWTWLNDSKIRKKPIDDLVFVIASNDGAFKSFTSVDAERRDQERRRAAFYERSHNYVKAIVVNPLSAKAHLKPEEVQSLFQIDRLDIQITNKAGNTQRATVRGHDLLDDEELIQSPIHGIYAVKVFPKLSIDAGIAPGETIDVDYFGRMFVIASNRENGVLEGVISFPPSDIVAQKYELVLLYPQVLKTDGEAYAIGVDEDQSGYSHIFEALEGLKTSNVAADADIPAEFRDFEGPVAKIVGEPPLSSLHYFTMMWTGTPIESADLLAARLGVDGKTALAR